MTIIQSVVDVETGEPQDDLLPEAKALIGKLGSSCTKVSEVVANKDEKVYSEITAGLERANKHAISRAQKVTNNIYSQLEFTFTFNIIILGSKICDLRKGLLCSWRRTWLVFTLIMSHVLEYCIMNTTIHQGPTLKLKRHVVVKKFERQIDDMYGTP